MFHYLTALKSTPGENFFAITVRKFLINSQSFLPLYCSGVCNALIRTMKHWCVCISTCRETPERKRVFLEVSPLRRGGRCACTEFSTMEYLSVNHRSRSNSSKYYNHSNSHPSPLLFDSVYLSDYTARFSFPAKCISHLSRLSARWTCALSLSLQSK